jgi:hypothetical protein
VCRAPVHPLLVAVANRTLDLPKNISAEQADLILELAYASVLRIVRVAKRPHRTNVFRRHRRRFRKDLNVATALPCALGDAPAVSRMGGQVRGAERVVPYPPDDVASHGTHGVEELPLAGLRPRRTIERDDAEVVDRNRRFTRKHSHRTARLPRRVASRSARAHGEEYPTKP